MEPHLNLAFRILTKLILYRIQWHSILHDYMFSPPIIYNIFLSSWRPLAGPSLYFSIFTALAKYSYFSYKIILPVCSQSSDNDCHCSSPKQASLSARPPACHFIKPIVPRKSFFSALYRLRAQVFNKQDIRKTFIKQEKMTELLLNELISQILGKHIFLGIVPGADQKQNFDNFESPTLFQALSWVLRTQM